MDYKPAIAAAALAAGIEPAIALAVASRESDAQQYWQSGPRKGSLKVSDKGAIGIMQVMPSTAPGVDLADPQQNIRAGVRYLSSLYRQFGNWPEALAAYNWGEGKVRRAMQGPWPMEVTKYVAGVLGAAGGASGGLWRDIPVPSGSPGLAAAAVLAGTVVLVLALK